MKTCPKCGAETTDFANRCPECGEDVSDVKAGWQETAKDLGRRVRVFDRKMAYLVSLPIVGAFIDGWRGAAIGLLVGILLYIAGPS